MSSLPDAAGLQRRPDHSQGHIEKVSLRYSGAPGGLAEIMVGRALMADPALFRKSKGGNAASLSEILSFHEALFEAYTTLFESQKNAMMRMKEYWFFQLCLFGEDGDEARLQKAASKIFRCKQIPDFEAAVREAAKASHCAATLATAGANRSEFRYSRTTVTSTQPSACEASNSSCGVKRTAL